jgi:uncharacterized Tic20 family protein
VGIRAIAFAQQIKVSEGGTEQSSAILPLAVRISKQGQVKIMTSDLSQNVRRWAAVYHLCSLVWIPFLPLLALILGGLSPQTPQTVFLSMLVGWLIVLVYAGLGLAFLLRRVLRDRHPYLEQQGNKAVRWQSVFGLYSTVLFVITTLLVIPACTAGSLKNPGSAIDFTLTWLLFWLGAEAAGVLLLQIPFAIIGAIKAYRGRATTQPSGNRK